MISEGQLKYWVSDEAQHWPDPISAVKMARELLALRASHKRLIQLSAALLSYVDCIPADVSLPTMPGIDRDRAEDTLANARKIQPEIP